MMKDELVLNSSFILHPSSFILSCCQPPSTLLMDATSSRSEVRPTCVFCGLLPPLKMSTRGMLTTPNLVATSGLSSTLSLPTLTLPAYCSASLSMVGPRARHGPHQGAQKSTTTGVSLCSTSFSQLASVNSSTF